MGWASKVREQLEVAQHRPTPRTRLRGSQFLPVRVVEGGGPSAPASDGEKLEILLRNGRSVRIGVHFDGGALSRVLQIVEGGDPC